MREKVKKRLRTLWFFPFVAFGHGQPTQVTLAGSGGDIPMEESTATESANVMIHWNSAPDRVYGVTWMPDLFSGQREVLATNLPATPPVNVYTDTVHGAEAQGYYRVHVTMP